MNYKTRKFKYSVLIIFILVITIGVAGYIYTYQQLINQGSYLADEHCIKVNPLIITRKNSYLAEMKLILASSSAEKVQKSLTNYLDASNTYLNQEKIWLAKERTFLDARIFNLLMPPEIKLVAETQYQMYEADYQSIVYTTQMFEEKDQTKMSELTDKIMVETIKRREAGDKYDALWRKPVGQPDWVYNFVKVPPSQCPAENLSIPVVPDSFTPTVNQGQNQNR